ncbi:DUF1190 domain-containing protein [Phenylobacterium sp. LH3H17]|uniref:DUF1190 domain-containing protein n=1 Tax=Phenylobacterium sp. LH3H17 TaxID=2903901 RepID=UPI0020C9DC38|nr:DUF1190 domain-containing protein [Phenylobacterium sp. LH3H17]UTP40848.1 DUF1190 domain-containing protein [Phenylobacterium sp. LH3H17]
MKRSSSLTLTTMLAGASLSVAACDDPPAAARWDQNSVAQGEQVETFQYADLDSCKTANQIPDAECDTAYAKALEDNDKSAPRFEAKATCEETYGEGNCVPRGSGGGSFFTPLLAGFVIGQMFDGGGNRYYRGTGLYRGRDGYTTGWGGKLGRDYATGRTTIGKYGIDPPDSVRQAPPRMQTRTSVVSRGGFGGGRGYGG